MLKNQRPVDADRIFTKLTSNYTKSKETAGKRREMNFETAGYIQQLKEMSLKLAPAAGQLLTLWIDLWSIKFMFKFNRKAHFKCATMARTKGPSQRPRRAVALAMHLPTILLYSGKILGSVQKTSALLPVLY